MKPIEIKTKIGSIFASINSRNGFYVTTNPREFDKERRDEGLTYRGRPYTGISGHGQIRNGKFDFLTYGTDGNTQIFTSEIHNSYYKNRALYYSYSSDPSETGKAYILNSVINGINDFLSNQDNLNEINENFKQYEIKELRANVIKKNEECAEKLAEIEKIHDEMKKMDKRLEELES